MSDIVISAENIGKMYTIGHQAERGGYASLRDVLMQNARTLWNKTKDLAMGKSIIQGDTMEEVWALKDVNFEIRRGETVGIIGRNGAGKSTLLKVLSRITEPSIGRVTINGRVASLLEVGTGFHPELTGRENVYLNGAILGMTRQEIKQKFNEIVAFAEVEKYLDTPVKRYSSGMYVRLAFAVAAHLEPEILVVDEVLSVGDFEFQQKCIEKMTNFANGGRTILFVSHNIGAIQLLCNRGILLEKGHIIFDDTVANTVHCYLNDGIAQEGMRVWCMDEAPALDDAVKLLSIRVIDGSGSPKTNFSVKEPIIVEVEYLVLKEKYSLNVHLYFSNETGDTLFVSMNNLDSPYRDSIQPEGLYRERCMIPANFLNEGTIRIEYLICTRPTSQYFVTIPDAISFQVTDDRSASGVRGNWVRDWPASMLRPRLDWYVKRINETPQDV